MWRKLDALEIYLGGNAFVIQFSMKVFTFLPTVWFLFHCYQVSLWITCILYLSSLFLFLSSLPSVESKMSAWDANPLPPEICIRIMWKELLLLNPFQLGDADSCSHKAKVMQFDPSYWYDVLARVFGIVFSVLLQRSLLFHHQVMLVWASHNILKRWKLSPD